MSRLQAAPPANDSFSQVLMANRLTGNMNVSTISIGGGNIAFTTSTALIDQATYDANEPFPYCADGNGGSRSVWYSFVSTTVYQMSAETVGSNYDTVIQVRRSGNPDNFANMNAETCNDFFDSTNYGVGPSRVQLTLQKGVTYYFQIANYYATHISGNNLVFNATMTPVAIDDVSPTVAIEQPLDGASYFSVPMIAGTAADGGANNNINNPGINRVEIQIFKWGTGQIWTGSSWQNYPTYQTSFGVNLYSPNSTNTGWDANNVTMPPWTSGNYNIRAVAYDRSGNVSVVTNSTFTFSLYTVDHDNWGATAQYIVPVNYSTVSANLNAIYALERNGSGIPYGNSDVWFRYVSSVNAPAQVDTIGSSTTIDTVLAVWRSTGGVPSPGSLINFNDDSNGSWSKVNFQLTSNETYYFQVYSFDIKPQGFFNLNFNQLAVDVTTPANITSLTASPGYSYGSVRLQWTATGDDGATGTAQMSEIRYSTNGPLTDLTSFTTATYLSSPIPQSGGSTEDLFVYGLMERKTAWVAIKIWDDNGNTSLSNSATVQVPGQPPAAANTALVSVTTITALPYFDESQISYIPGNQTDVAGYCGEYKSPNRHDVWYKYTTTSTGINFTANTFNTTIPDTAIQIWKSLDGTSNLPQLVNASCNDDEPGFGNLSRTNIQDLALGDTIYIQVVTFYQSGTLRFQFGQADSVKPGQITSLAATPGAQNGEVNLTWIEPADNGYDLASGNVSKYLIRYSSLTSINNGNWTNSYNNVATATVQNIEFSPVNQFPPSPVSAGTLMSYTIRSLVQGVTYYYGVRSMDQAGNTSNTSNSPYARAKAPSQATGDGQGTAQIRDLSNNILSSVIVGSQTSLSIRFTVGSSSITAGGRISLRIPDSWSMPTLGNCPSCVGNVTLSTITPTLSASAIELYTDPADPRVVIASPTVKLNAGDTISFRYLNAWVPYQKQTGVQFQIKVQGTNNSLLLPIASQPAVDIVAGPPAYVGFPDWNQYTLGANQTSPGLIIEPKDFSWTTTAATKSMKLRIFAFHWDTHTYTFRYDTGAQFSKDNFNTDIYFASGNVTNNFLVSTSAVQVAQYYSSLGSELFANATAYSFSIPVGSVGEKIFYRSSTTGDTILWIEYNNDFDAGPSTYTISRWFRIIPQAMQINNFTINPPTITPDGNGTGDFATINFVPNNADVQWRVRIGTDPIFGQLSPLPNNVGSGGFGSATSGGVSASSINVFMDSWGNGAPQGLSWYGYDNNGNILPDGNYIVRVEDVGGVVVSTQVVAVDSDYLNVFVEKTDSNGAANAFVYVNGQSGQGYVYRQAQTDSTGRARIWGLKSGGSGYNINVNYYDPAILSNFTGLKNNVQADSNPASVSTVTFTLPAQIRIQAVISTDAVEAGYDQWGSVQVADSNGLSVGYGSLRIPAGSNVSDSGWSSSGFPSSWTVINAVTGRSYKIRADIYGFGVKEIDTGTLLTSGTTDFVLNFVKRPKITGYVILPSTQQYSTWVSIEGTKQGESFPTAWGGAYIRGEDQGQATTTGTYIIDVDTGVYKFKAKAFGFGTTAWAPITVPQAGIGTILAGDAWNGSAIVSNGLDFKFSTPSAGVAGTLTVNGNTETLPSYQIQNGSYTVYINAYSPTNYSYGSTQVKIATNATTASAAFSIPGLEDGVYDVFTYLEGFEVDPPGPQRVNVVNGAGTKNLTLKKFNGGLYGLFKLRSNDPQNVSLSISGPVSSNTVSLDQASLVNSSYAWTVGNLGTGFYTVSAFYKTNGQSKTYKVNVVSGQNSTVTFKLDGSTFSISGTARVQPFTFGVTGGQPNGIRIDTISDLVSKVKTESIYVGSGNVTLPIVRIEAFPREESTYNRGIRNFVDIQGGYGNTGVSNVNFGFGQLRYSSVTEQGTWTLSDLPEGIYELRHPVNLDAGATYYNYSQGGSYESNGTDVANEVKVIRIKSDGSYQVLEPLNGDLEFVYTAGSDVSGRILLPPDIQTDTRFLTILVQNNRKEVVSWQSVYLNGNSVNYKITNLSNGDYTLIVQDERRGSQSNPDQYVPGSNFQKYVTKPLILKVTGGNLTNQNVQLYRSGYLEGKFAIVRISSSGARSTELITANNQNLLPENFSVYAYSDILGRELSGMLSMDCVSNGAGGGNGNASSVCSPRIDSVKGTFLISSIFPDIEYNVRFAQNTFSSDQLGKGKMNLVPQQKTGISVGAGQTQDMGTIEMDLGLTLTGSVVNTSTQPVPNIRIRAKPSGTMSHSGEIETFTDSKGSFTISGLSPDARYYDLTFGARNNGDDRIVSSGLETRFAQKVKRAVDVRASSMPINVVMELGLGSIAGQITTSDGGNLKNPFGESAGYPNATVIVNKQGDIPTDNPLGDIQTESDLNGNYSIDKLTDGTYDIYAISLGYAVGKTSVTVSGGQATKNIVLTTGLELKGELKKPDGTSPTTSEANALIAADPSFNLVIGDLKANPVTGAIESYAIAGLQSGTTYTLIIFNEDDDSIIPPESPVNITTNTANYKITFAHAKPEVFMKGKKTGVKVSGLDQYRFEFETTQALRNKTLTEKSDLYWQQVVTINSSVGGAGTISADPDSANPVSVDRKKVTVLYVPASNTTKVTFKFDSPTAVLQPGTSVSYQATNFFTYYMGLDGQKISKINMAQGGNIGIEGDSSGAAIPAGSITDTNGNPISVSSNVNVGMQKADVSIGTGVVNNAAPQFGEMESNLPPVMLRAIDSMQEIYRKDLEKAQADAAASGIKAAGAVTASQVASNVLGAFYDIFLPAGVSRTLSKNAKVTMQYSSSTADPNEMNVYFYNDTNSTMTTTSGVAVPPGAYGLENSSKTIDTANNTISVSVNHFTVYVVVNATSSVLGAGVTINSSSGTTSGTFTKGQVNIITLTAGTTFTLNSLPVSGGADESHMFTLISTGSGNSGIILNVQSVLKTLSVAVNQESLVDLNDDGPKDISLIVSGVSGNQATVRIAAQLGLTLLEGSDYTGTEIEAFNFPNPFDASRQGFLFTANRAAGGPASASVTGATAIRYALPSNLGAGTVGVTVEIFDVAGDLVRKLHFGDRATGKYHYGDWDGKNEDGQTVASGVYIARLVINGAGKSKIFKMVVVK